MLGNGDNFYTLAGLADEVGEGSAEFLIVDDNGSLSSFGLDDLFDAGMPDGDAGAMMADLEMAFEAAMAPASEPVDMPAAEFADGGSDLVTDDLPFS